MAAIGFNISNETQINILNGFTSSIQDKNKIKKYTKLAKDALTLITARPEEYSDEYILVKKTGLIKVSKLYARLNKKEDGTLALEILKVSNKKTTTPQLVFHSCIELHNGSKSVVCLGHENKSEVILTNSGIASKLMEKISDPIKEEIKRLCGDHIPFQQPRAVLTIENKAAFIFNKAGDPLIKHFDPDAPFNVSNQEAYKVILDFFGVLYALEAAEIANVTVNCDSFVLNDLRLLLVDFRGLRPLPPQNDELCESGQISYSGNYLHAGLAEKIKLAKTNKEQRLCLKLLTRYSFASVIYEVMSRKIDRIDYYCTKDKSVDSLEVADRHLTERKRYNQLTPVTKKLMDLLIAENPEDIETIVNLALSNEFKKELYRSLSNTNYLLGSSFT
ncbi:MAG: hypothetical protein WC222_09480 [Parachlamydiales bacterium]|jgi:hypothetical protein